MEAGRPAKSDRGFLGKHPTVGLGVAMALGLTVVPFQLISGEFSSPAFWLALAGYGLLTVKPTLRMAQLEWRDRLAMLAILVGGTGFLGGLVYTLTTTWGE